MSEVNFELEKARGEKAQRAYDEFVKEFIDERKQVCFEAFKDISVLKVEELMETKRLLMALDALESHMEEIITTGKLASKSLEENEELH